MKPMLAESINQNQLERFLIDDNWFAECKLDGHRILFVIRNGVPRGLNRSGEPFKNKINKQVIEELSGPQWGDGMWVLDTEYMSDVDSCAYVFDLLETPRGSLIEVPYHLRREMLEALFAKWAPFHVRLVPSLKTEHGKRDLLSKVEEAGGEGLMFKNKNAAYSPGKRSFDNLKHKLWKSCEVVVLELYREGKRSIAVGMYDDDGNIVDVGSCTMSDRNLARTQEGMVAELKYLYFGAGNRLYQPSFLRIRTDKKPEECTMDQVCPVNKVPVF